MSLKDSTRPWLAVVVSLSLVTSGMPVFGRSVMAQGPGATPADTAFALLEAAEKEIPRDTFDPAAVVKAVGREPAALLAWVRDRTYWVPYRGALRGPVGVLMDRLGNSVDRSLLLAELLRTAGHTVRLAHATLSEAQGREALQAIRPVPANPMQPSALAPARTDAELSQVARQLGVASTDLRDAMRTEIQQAEKMRDELVKRTAAQVPFLVSQVGSRPPAADVTPATLTAIRDHWWVQRLDRNQWVDLDPLRAGPTVAEQTFAFDRPVGEMPLPPEATQDISIRVVAEQWKAGALAEKVVLAHTLRPAEAFGQPILLQMAPLNWPKLVDVVKAPDPGATIKANALTQTEWVPLLAIGDRIVRQNSVMDNGEINDKPGQPRGAAGAFAAAFDAFGGGPEPEPEGRLTAAWIEFEIHVPGASPGIVRRELFDFLDRQRRSARPVADPAPNDQQRLVRALSLVTTMKILPLTSRLSSEYVMSQMSLQTIQNRQGLSEVAARASAGDLAGVVERAQRMKPSLDRRLLELALTRFEWSTARQETYLDAPNILTYRSALFQNASGDVAMRHGFDIVSNAVAIRPGAAVDPFQLRLTQGVIDTNLEDLLMRTAGTANAGALLAASGQPAQWTVLRQPNDPAFSQANVSAEIRGRLAEDVRAGYVVIAPRAASSTPSGFAWWRIDPRTGETLGLGPQGWGQATVEIASVYVFSGLVFFDICMLARGGGAQSEADFNRRMAQCACLGFGGGLLVTVALCGCSWVAIGLVVEKTALCWGISGSANSAP